VQNLGSSWSLLQVSKQWQQPPSQILQLTNSFDAYCFDQCLAWFDGHVEGLLDKIEYKDSKKTQAVRSSFLTRFIGGPDAERQTKQYADPGAR
jgi:hypothetical protein